MRTRTRAALVALALAGAAISGCGTTIERPTKPPNVIVIVIDTLRADRLGSAGNDRGLTPFLDRLATRAFVFRRAYAPASWTKPSVASLLTSRYESQHRVNSFAAVLGDGELTLPEVLRERGWLTLGYSANSLLGEAFGFAQGYDTYRAFLSSRQRGPGGKRLPMRARALVELVRQRLDARTRAERSQPVFLYVQFMEPHGPYAPPPDLLDRSLGGRQVNVARINGAVRLGWPMSGDDLVAATGVYDAMVAATDRELRGLFEALKPLRLLGNSVIVVTADHGQEFMDHGRVGHGQSLYQELVHVPLLLVVPGYSSRVDVEEAVSLVDVAPTVLDLAGLPVPASFEGRSLRPLLLERPDWRNGFQLGPRLRRWWRGEPGGTAFFEGGPQRRKVKMTHRRGVVRGDDKLLVGTDGRDVFYDLGADPTEREGDVLPDTQRRALAEELERFHALTGQRNAQAEVGEVDEKQRKELRALGYVE